MTGDKDRDHRDTAPFYNVLGMTIMGLAALAFVAHLVTQFGWVSAAGLVVEGVLFYLGWRWATRDSRDNEPGTSGTVPPRDSPAVTVDTENPDPGQFIPERDTLAPGEFYPPLPSRDESRDHERDTSR